MSFKERIWYNCQECTIPSNHAAVNRAKLRQWFVNNTLPINSPIMLPGTVGVVEQTPVPGYHLVRTRDKNSLTGVLATELFEVPVWVQSLLDTENTDYMSWMLEEDMASVLAFALDREGHVNPKKFLAWCDLNGISREDLIVQWTTQVRKVGKVWIDDWLDGATQYNDYDQDKLLNLCHRTVRIVQRQAWQPPATSSKTADYERDDYQDRLRAWIAEEPAGYKYGARKDR